MIYANFSDSSEALSGLLGASALWDCYPAAAAASR